MLCFWSNIPKTSFRNFWSSHFEVRTHTSLFMDENPGRKNMSLFDFWKEPKVTSTTTVQINNTELETTFSLPRARNMHSRRAAPKKHQVVLNMFKKWLMINLIRWFEYKIVKNSTFSISLRLLLFAIPKTTWTNMRESHHLRRTITNNTKSFIRNEKNVQL